MRARALLLISLVLNVALATAVVTWLSSKGENTPRVDRTPKATVIQSNLVRIVKTNVLVRPRAFTWQEVESPDYSVYVENLRALGMPESTLRDIIVADVDQIFLQRRREAMASQDMEWWRQTPTSESQSNLLARTRAIDAERVELLARLLGPDWEKERDVKEVEPVALAGPVLGALSPEVKAAVQDIAARSRVRTTEYLARVQASGAEPSALELAKMRDETRQQLAAVLNPQQLEEFLLRHSENANRLRQELAGFNATPEEFRALFRATDGIDRDLQLRSPDPTTQRALEQQRLFAVRTALGAERFTAYQALRDPAYREALAATEQFGGGPETLQALFSISQAANAEFNRIRTDPALTDEQKQAQMRQAEIEQQRARAAVLGDSQDVETAPVSVPSTPQPRAHAIIPGDTLGILAVQYGVPIGAIRAANPGVDINRVRPGTVINIPPPGTPAPPPLPPGLQRR